MLSYLEKFHSLPADLQDGVSTPAVMQAIAEIESKYGITLAAIVMKVMVKDVSLIDLPKLLVFEFGLDGKTAQQVVEELKDRVFINVSEYLGLAKEAAINIDKDEKLNEWIDQKQTEAGIRSSTFFFSPEDEEEIKTLTTKLAGPETKAIDNTEINDKIASILPALQVNFSSAEMTDRLKKILFTYLRGVRSKIDTRQTLLKPVENGGMGLDSFLADKILNITDKINSEPLPVRPTTAPSPAPVQASAQKNPPQPAVSPLPDKPKDIDELIARMKQTGVRDVDYDFSKIGASKPQPETHKPSLENKPFSETAKPEAVLEKMNDKDIVLDVLNKQGAEISEEDRRKFITDLKAVQGPPSPLHTAPTSETKAPPAMAPPVLNLAAKRMFAGKEGRGKFADVKKVPKLVGPIDELGMMDLVNFRRLNDDPRVAAATIREKISFLEEDNYAQKLAGIKAWRQSPLNKLYIDIGHESISNKSGIDSAILARKDREQEYLLPEEFYAIMDLNKTLRF